ncbi:MAG TPA: Ig-like domain-containing protein [Terriglobales bacterium]|nr:Ig-like domain-containing protein [Terriglobales bacterium]
MVPILRVSLYVVLLAAASVLAESQELSVGSHVGDFGSANNLCSKDAGGTTKGPYHTSCTGSFEDGGASGAAVSTAYVSPSKLRVSAAATLSNNHGPVPNGIEGDAEALLNDTFTFGNLSQDAYFQIFSGLAATSAGSSLGSVTLQLNMGGNECSFQLSSGAQSCGVLGFISPSTSYVDFQLVIGGVATVACLDGTCGGGASSVDASSGSNGAKVLAVMVVDENGVPIPGVTVTAASGFKYPSRFASTTTLTSSANPSNHGDPVTFTATVNSFGRPSTPTGKVTFKDLTSSTTLGHGSLTSGVATFTTSTLSLGTHSIVVTYGGDALSAGSKSAALAQQVN